MAKPNVNTANRAELVEAGVRAELADEILKRRRKGAVSLEALEEVSGVGPATLEQLRQALDFRDPPPAAGNAGGPEGGRAAQPDERTRAREGGDERRPHEQPPVRLGVKVARDTAAAGAETTAAEATAQVARGGLQAVRRTAGAAGQVTRRSGESTAELGQALTELVREQ